MVGAEPVASLRLLATLLILAVAGCGRDTGNSAIPEAASLSPASSGEPLKGMFRYMADAPLFRDCRDNRQYPVSMEARSGRKPLGQCWLLWSCLAAMLKTVATIFRLLLRPF